MFEEGVTQILIHKEKVFETHITDIQYELERKFLSSEEDNSGDLIEVIYTESSECVNHDPEMFDIEVLEKLIIEAKKDGANYLSIDWNEDHWDYRILGFRVKREQNLEEELEKKNEIELRRTEKEIERLEKQLQKLKEKL